MTVFSGASPHVVDHELGHAILDAVKPELFNAMSIEAAAFHEAFGDISSILSSLQVPSLRDFVLKQTGGRLNSNSRLSQLARELGWAIRVQINRTAVDSDCLRNASNNFFYRNPAGLPARAPATQLSSEPHSFSRVFSGAFLDVLAAHVQDRPSQLQRERLGQASGGRGGRGKTPHRGCADGFRVAELLQPGRRWNDPGRSLPDGRALPRSPDQQLCPTRDPLPFGGRVSCPRRYASTAASSASPDVRQSRQQLQFDGRDRWIQEDRARRARPSAAADRSPASVSHCMFICQPGASAFL